MTEQRISVPDLMQVLTAGRPSVMERAVFLCKFHRGLDSSTMADGFNHEALPQLIKWFGSDRPEAWDLERCPVPVVLTRVKTDYRHTGFLERDAVEAIQRYASRRRERSGQEVKAGGPLFLNKFGRPINADWITARFSFLADRAGVRHRVPGTRAYNMDSHELRDLLKSTLIDCGCRYDVADHVIGHRPKDSYEKQALLYPETMRAEYAKASGRLNRFTKFSNVTSGADDAGRIRAEMQDMAAKLRERDESSSVLDAAVRRYDAIIDGQRAAGEEEDTTGPVGVVDEALTVDTVIQRYKLSIMEEDAAQRHAYETVLDRLEIAKAIYQLTNDQQVDDRFADKTAGELFDMLDATYEPDAFDGSSTPTPGHGVRAANTVPHNGGVTVDVNYVHVSIQSEHSCATNSNVSCTARSTMTSFSNGDATISVDFNYPEDFDENIRVLRNANCYDFDHNETVKRHDVLAATVPGSGQVPAQVCTLKADRASETESIGCNAFGPDRIVVISASNTYGSDEISRDVQLGWITTSWLFT